MRGVWVLVHVLGYVLWLGGGLATMVLGVAAKRFAPDHRLSAYRLTSAIQRVLLGPGAVAVVLSGILLSMPYMKEGTVPGWLMLMMTSGILGALIAMGVTVPTAARMGRLQADPRGDLPEIFSELRTRLVIAGSISGGLGLVALVAGTVLRG
ncbi:MAG TPA: hypothetical protein VL563_06895 [Gemmatimonadales bacterium]|jgi:hypothetical protein|nr:hypothetical protein [Gemmatimonadales bacterium]